MTEVFRPAVYAVNLGFVAVRIHLYRFILTQWPAPWVSYPRRGAVNPTA